MDEKATADTRDGRVRIAKSTLAAIKAGSITLADRNALDLAAKVRFSSHNTRYYPPDDQLFSAWATPDMPAPSSSSSPTEISFCGISTLDGARLLYDNLSRSRTSFGRIAVLNFASATRPGGGFLDGAQAQEESIARSSTLHPSLLTDSVLEYYKLHLRDPRRGFYHHAMVYTPSVVILRNDSGEWVAPFEVDVLTCAAVNAGRVRYENGKNADGAKTEKMIEQTMKERMGKILFLMERQGAKNLVLGSFGTGAFQNDVKMVARIWAELLTNQGSRFRSSFDRVVFAILGASTFATFKQTFEKATDTKGTGAPIFV